jgi:hypothetical protein
METKIMKVEPKPNGYYDVFFKFLPIPVEMNKGYLKTIVENIESIENK